MAEGSKEHPISFKRIRKRNHRHHQNCDSDDDNAEGSEAKHTLEEIKEKQKLRMRTHGISLVGLTLGKKVDREDEVALEDPFGCKGGGLVNMHALKSGKISQDAFDVTIGTQFFAETNCRDEDEEMLKYIDKELKKRKGLQQSAREVEEREPQPFITPEEAALQAIPDHLRESSSYNSEEMLSNQMLNGIPEIDLGIAAKIRNIEATEEAKQKLLHNQLNRKDAPSHFVPANMAVNFMQHSRFNIENNSDAKKRTREYEKPQHQNNTTNSQGVKRATDDYHYDKFKKQFRRF